MIKNISIDLSDIKTREDLFGVFIREFGFPQYFGNNWDAFFDVLNSLDSYEEIHNGVKIKITGIRLGFRGFDIFKESFPRPEFEIFCSILSELSLERESQRNRFYFMIET